MVETGRVECFLHACLCCEVRIHGFAVGGVPGRVQEQARLVLPAASGDTGYQHQGEGLAAGEKLHTCNGFFLYLRNLQWHEYGSEDVLQCLCAVFGVDTYFLGTCSVCDPKQCQRQYLADVGVLHMMGDCLFSMS